MRPKRFRLVNAACVALLAVLAAACGGDGDKSSAGDPTEKAFLTAMVHHHDSGIDMAKVAKERGDDPVVRRLGDAIVAAQQREIDRMKSIHQRLFGARLVPDASAHDGLGLTADEAGMTHSPAMAAELESARPFDRAFVDEMVPHHAGAVRMVRVLLRRTRDRELRRLAEGISSTQKREIEEMNGFREREYGGPVSSPAGHGGGHEGHGGEPPPG